MKTGTAELTPPKWPGDHAIERGRDAATVASAGIAGFLAGHVVIALLTGVPRVVPGLSYGYNLLTMEHITNADRYRRDDCPDCGER